MLFGPFLDALFNRVNEAVAEALDRVRDVGVQLEIEAARDMGLVIANAKNAFREELETAVDKLQDSAAQVYNELSTLEDKFFDEERRAVRDVMVRAQQLLNSSIFSNGKPQVTTIAPRLLVVRAGHQEGSLRIEGNFPKLGQQFDHKPLLPTMTLNGLPCRALTETNQSIQVAVPLAPFRDTPAERYGYVQGELRVPYIEGIYGFRHRREAIYPVAIGAVPVCAGVVKPTFQSLEREKKVETNTASRHFDATAYHHQGHYHVERWIILPKDGYSIDMNRTPKVVEEPGAHGNHWCVVKEMNSQQIIMEVGLDVDSWKHLGKVTYTVQYDEYHYVSVHEDREGDPLSLQWNDIVPLTPNDGETIARVRFEAFDGSVQTYALPTEGLGILQSRQAPGGRWQIWAKPPEHL